MPDRLTLNPDVRRHTAAMVQRYPAGRVTEGAHMQTNEHAGQVKHGPRRGHAKQARTALRETPETRAERRDAEGSSRHAARPPARTPRQYGAGF